MEVGLILGGYIGIIIVSALVLIAFLAFNPTVNWRGEQLQRQKNVEQTNVKQVLSSNLTPKLSINETPPIIDKQDGEENSKEPGKELISASEEEKTIEEVASLSRTDQVNSIVSSDNNGNRRGKNESLPPPENEINPTFAEKAGEELQKQFLQNKDGDLTSLFTDTIVEESWESKFAKTLNNVDILDLLNQFKTLVKHRRKGSL